MHWPKVSARTATPPHELAVRTTATSVTPGIA